MNDNGSLIMTNNAYFHLEYEDIITVFVLSQSMLPWNAKLLKFLIGPTHSRITSTLDFLVQPGNEERLCLGHDNAIRLDYTKPSMYLHKQKNMLKYPLTDSHNSRSHCFI